MATYPQAMTSPSCTRDLLNPSTCSPPSQRQLSCASPGLHLLAQHGKKLLIHMPTALVAPWSVLYTQQARLAFLKDIHQTTWLLCSRAMKSPNPSCSKLCTPGSFRLQIFGVCFPLPASVTCFLFLSYPEYHAWMHVGVVFAQVVQAPLESIMACIAEVEKSEVPSVLSLIFILLFSLPFVFVSEDHYFFL